MKSTVHTLKHSHGISDVNNGSGTLMDEFDQQICLVRLTRPATINKYFRLLTFIWERASLNMCIFPVSFFFSFCSSIAVVSVAMWALLLCGVYPCPGDRVQLWPTPQLHPLPCLSGVDRSLWNLLCDNRGRGWGTRGKHRAPCLHCGKSFHQGYSCSEGPPQDHPCWSHCQGTCLLHSMVLLFDYLVTKWLKFQELCLL